MSKDSIRVGLAQMDCLVGDIEGNTESVIDWMDRARGKGVDLLLFPELVLTGYPPEDLLLRGSLALRIDAAIRRVAEASYGICAVVGYPRRNDQGLYNAAGVFSDGSLVDEYYKQRLPNYQVFDEKRYFRAGDRALVVDVEGLRCGITICEDIWHPAPAAQAAEAGAALILNINASPFHADKPAEREAMLQQRTQETGLPVLYLNMIGGQDELVFDGGSLGLDGSGRVRLRAPHFDEGLYLARVGRDGSIEADVCVEPPGRLESIYQALLLGLRDYVNKNRFGSVLLGLSGGIDSALTLAIAVDALGPNRVRAFMMPFHYTADISRADAALEAERLGVDYAEISIEPMYEAFLQALLPVLGERDAGITEQNLQARCRGTLLMAISNQTGALVLTTGNKSEIAVGYSTLYGDMAGGFSVIKDVPKTLVYQLAEYRNRDQEVIPRRVIERPPSAELAPGQRDEDSLPPYELLDGILHLYIEEDLSAEAIIAGGFRREDVYRVLRMVDINEYKRRQAPVGTRISKRGFGRDRRYPITNGWSLGH